MNKTIILTLDIDNYEPTITAITYPRMRAWAKKIGAEFEIINKNKFPNMPAVMNKFQVPSYARGYDWCYFIDADALISTNTPPLHEWIGRDQVLFWGLDANNRYKTDIYARRNRQFKSACSWFMLTSDWVREDFYNSELPPNWEDNIMPNKQESYKSVRSLVDDYKITCNCDRFGFHCITAMDLLKSKGLENRFVHHVYNISTEEKLHGQKDSEGKVTVQGLIDLDKIL
jgi:hypothetical protein